MLPRRWTLNRQVDGPTVWEGERIEVMPVSEHLEALRELEERLTLTQQAWDTEVESANEARLARNVMQARWSGMVEQSKQHVEAANVRTRDLEARHERLREAAQAVARARQPSVNHDNAMKALRAALKVGS